MDKRLPDPVFPVFPEKLLEPGPATIPQTRDWTPAASTTPAPNPGGLSQDASLAVPVCSLADNARQVPSHHLVPLCRIQVQSRLLVLLVLQQHGEGDDGGCCATFYRFSPRQWLPCACPYGWRAPAAPRFHTQGRLPRSQEGGYMVFFNINICRNNCYRE